VSAAPLSYKSLENLHQNGVKLFLDEHFFFSGLQGLVLLLGNKDYKLISFFLNQTL
jgi:hypothetical protein